jgi:hypothetical protein
VDDIFNTLEVWTIQTGNSPVGLGTQRLAAAELAGLSTLAGTRETHATAVSHSLVLSSHETKLTEGNSVRSGQGSESGLVAGTIRATTKQAARLNQFKAIETLFSDWEGKD